MFSEKLSVTLEKMCLFIFKEGWAAYGESSLLVDTKAETGALNLIDDNIKCFIENE